MQLLLLLHKGVVLGHSLQGQLVHLVDHVGPLEPLLLKGLDGDGKGGGEKHDLALLGAHVDQLLDHGLELLRQELVGLVQHNHLAVLQLGDALLPQVEDSSRSGHHHVHGVVQAHDVVLEGGASRGHHDLAPGEVLADLLAHLGRLEGQLARGHQDQRLDAVLGGLDTLQDGDDVGGRLSRAVLGAREEVAAGESDRDALLLDGRGLVEAFLVDAHEELPLEVKVFKLAAFRVGDVAGSEPRVLGGQLEPVLPALARLLADGGLDRLLGRADRRLASSPWLLRLLLLLLLGTRHLLLVLLLLILLLLHRVGRRRHALNPAPHAVLLLHVVVWHHHGWVVPHGHGVHRLLHIHVGRLLVLVHLLRRLLVLLRWVLLLLPVGRHVRVGLRPRGRRHGHLRGDHVVRHRDISFRTPLRFTSSKPETKGQERRLSCVCA
mmetsp:Transcript_1791/g.4137  ORF Transcript_1791/g.4137 Transcript_1791/m.4137 type:complete len:435 (-) Transcript_1791:147-1451(-)